VHRYRFSRSLLIAAAIIIAIIGYGSLYPFTFRQPADDIGPARKLLQSWAEAPIRTDFLANILFYIPLGFCGVLIVAEAGRALQAIWLATIIGALLSTSMELTQYYIAGRVTAANDVYANVIGTALGAVIGSITHGNIRWTLLREITSNRVPCLLLALWLGSRLFPYVPTIDLHKYWNALKPVVLHPSLTGYDLFRHTALWLTIDALIEATVGLKRAWLLFPLFIGAVLGAKVLIVGNALNTAEIAGAGSALGAWLILAVSVDARFRVTVIALLLCAYVIIERLAPFQFTAQSRHFGLIPFLGFMYGSLEVNVMSFFEKAFLYGSLIWLLGKAGLRFGISTILVAIMLFAASWAETYLADRSAEITDAVMALLIGTMIALIEGETRRKETPITGTS
jgi:VanZ family protein